MNMGDLKEVLPVENVGSIGELFCARASNGWSFFAAIPQLVESLVGQKSRENDGKWTNMKGSLKCHMWKMWFNWRYMG